MKTSEDKLNEALRDVLKRKFDDYEEQPNPTAYERIRARIKPGRGGKYGWLTGALVLIIISGVFFSQFNGENSPSFSATDIAIGHSEKGKDIAATPLKHRTAVAVALKTPSHAEARKVYKTAKKASVPLSAIERSIVFRNDPGSKPASRSQSLHTAIVGDATVNHRDGAGDAHINGRNDDLSKAAAGTDGLAAIMDAETPADVELPADELPLEEIDAIPLKETLIPLQLRGVVAPAYKPAKVIVTHPAKVAWLFNVAALHSYQILTVPSSAAKDFQNFNFPSLFTARSMGYKFSGGVERKGIQVQLHYSSFRQTYSYEIANNNYLVQPDDKGEYYTVRQGDRMEENRKFSMLGVGVSKQLRWGHSPVSRFYAAFGLEYSHDLNSSQSLGWLSLGLGKQFAVTRNTAFSIGPYAEFSPVKVKGIANPFYYQPYRVGITAGLRFVRP
jgi:hypothetical protein